MPMAGPACQWQGLHDRRRLLGWLVRSAVGPERLWMGLRHESEQATERREVGSSSLGVTASKLERKRKGWDGLDLG